MIFVYELAPIDFWNGWQTEAEYLPKNEKEEIDAYRRFRERAQELAHRAGWEGDVRFGPYVSALPNPETSMPSDFMIAWKQENNGTTYVASPYELPWLGNPTISG
ncbi:hypothetical protein [Sinorhizobium meliloti]|uniref:hypothetical protein n=1 Tax=Rhizobium meliloti TaxID=382 RepID=UPI000FD91321|nr:hypothetical protein [Sinorhizobium meliloti]QGJ73801.1 hypothetical protein C3L21_07115 [Sinorhizobium meliloti]RVG89040.1 hypothetical protein CN218_26175 [Sinorhizobium meliloti]RVK89644.1 hypothetical protein CN150_30145 [Sinorhizobium meliloti]RVL60737.1 hypothetical protein CN137_18245 [Sinorhizobium meliloti]